MKKTPKTSKAELELQKEIFKFGRFKIVFDTIKTLIKGGIFIVSIHFGFKGLEPFIGQGESLIATIVENWKLGQVVPSVIALLMGGLYYRERTGKQRAIKAKSHFQKLAEHNDPNRSSSSLTEDGMTPSDEEIADIIDKESGI